MADYGAELLSAAKRLDVDPPGRFREMKNVVWVPLSADSRDYRLSAYALAIWPLLRPALQELPHPPPTVPAEAVDALAGWAVEALEALASLPRGRYRDRRVGVWVRQ